jgi:hypothetical protein
VRFKQSSVLLFAVALAACGKNSRNVSSPTPATKSPASTQIKSDYKSLSAEEVFKSKFKSVDLVCPIYVVDKVEVSDADQPIDTLRLQVFPAINGVTALTVASKSSTFVADVSLQPTLSTLDMKVADQIVSQSPVVVLSGTSKLSSKSANATSSESKISGVIILFVPSTSNFPVDGQAIDDQTHGIAGAYRIACHLEGKTSNSLYRII